MQSHGHNVPVNIRTFGFSISEPIDIDNNGLVNYYATLYYMFFFVNYVLKKSIKYKFIYLKKNFLKLNHI